MGQLSSRDTKKVQPVLGETTMHSGSGLLFYLMNRSYTCHAMHSMIVFPRCHSSHRSVCREVAVAIHRPYTRNTFIRRTGLFAKKSTMYIIYATKFPCVWVLLQCHTIRWQWFGSEANCMQRSYRSDSSIYSKQQNKNIKSTSINWCWIKKTHATGTGIKYITVNCKLFICLDSISSWKKPIPTQLAHPTVHQCLDCFSLAMSLDRWCFRTKSFEDGTFTSHRLVHHGGVLVYLANHFRKKSMLNVECWSYGIYLNHV